MAGFHPIGSLPAPEVSTDQRLEGFKTKKPARIRLVGFVTRIGLLSATEIQ
jgi:hypothetical protein